MKLLRQNSGFTLIELLVVIAIIGILAAVIMSSLADSREQARIASVQGQLRSIHTAVEILRLQTGLYPHGFSDFCPPGVNGTSNNEVDLSQPSSGLVATDGSFPGWNGPYIPDVIDPWGTPYYLDEDYRCTAGAVGCNGVADAGNDSSVLVSCGPNKALADDACAYDDDNIVYAFCRD